MLEGAGEERPLRRRRLELAPVVAEADDHRARVQAAERLEQDMDALVVEELAEVDDRRLVAGKEGLESSRVSLVRKPLARVPRVRRVATGLLEQAGEGPVARPRPELVEVDARRHLVDAVDVADDVLEHLADVRGADEDRLGPGEHLAPPRDQLVVPAHRVLELRAVDLHRIPPSDLERHRPTREHVVREDEVGREPLPNRSRVRGDVALPLLARQLLEAPRLEPLVAVDDEDREDAADRRPHGLGAAEVVRLWVRLLGEDDHLVAGAAPLPRQRPRVDVRARPGEQVAVPEEDAHRRL